MSAAQMREKFFDCAAHAGGAAGGGEDRRDASTGSASSRRLTNSGHCFGAADAFTLYQG
jgi:hypothetical protein